MEEELLKKIEEDNKNLIIEGGIDSGKTTNVLFPLVSKFIDNKENLFILDSKKEYINTFYDKLKAQNYNIIILNLRDLDNSEGWNPLTYPYNLYKSGKFDLAQEYLEKISHNIFADRNAQDEFLSFISADLFNGVAMGLFEDGKEEEININSINNMVNNLNDSTNYLMDYFNKKGEHSIPYVYACATVFAPSDTKKSVLTIFKQKLRLYVSRDKLSKLLSKTTFDLNDINTKPTAIILINKNENSNTNNIVSLFIEQLYSFILDNCKTKMNFILDNFDAVSYINDFIYIYGSCNAHNIVNYIATRSHKEIASNYGNYILNLCNMLRINNNSLKLKYNFIEKDFQKDFRKVSIKRADIKYPKLLEESVKIFDLKNYLGVSSSKKSLSTSKENIDKMIKEIDTKINKIEKM